MSDNEENSVVLSLLREAASSRRRTARAMLDAYAAEAFEAPATQADIEYWIEELADTERELARLAK